MNLGEKNGVFAYDEANGKIAEKLRECAKFIQANSPTAAFLTVFTQKAVSDALNNNIPGLKDGDTIGNIRVFQMHVHKRFEITQDAITSMKQENVPEKILENLSGIKTNFTDEREYLKTLKASIGNTSLTQFKKIILKHTEVKREIRTIAAFRCALERFTDNPPDQIILIAHPKHLKRALYDLKGLVRILFQDRIDIKVLHIGDAVYPKGISRLTWARINLLGWIGDSISMASLRHPKLGANFIIEKLLNKFNAKPECAEGFSISSSYEK